MQFRPNDKIFRFSVFELENIRIEMKRINICKLDLYRLLNPFKLAIFSIMLVDRDNRLFKNIGLN